MNYLEQSKYTAACYCRLSKDDLQDGTSISIDTQKKVLEDYCKSNGFNVYDFYCDDGFTGTNFERPDFQRMMKDVQNGFINMVIVKDLSRLGRNYIETGKLIEEIFPENKIRFIAIGDNVDTDRENLDLDLMLPMKNVFNQYYPADCSRKTRQAFKTKAMRGEFLGTNAPYGYQKSKKDKHILEIDPVTAPVVVEIFEMAAYKGYGYSKITRVLSERKILTPTAYRYQSEGKTYNKDPYDWNLISVRRILENTEYLGCVVNGKKKKISFKSKKVIQTPQEKWIIAENMHEPIITQRLWDDAHNHLDSRKRVGKLGEINIFSGLLKCDKCGYALAIAGTKPNKKYFSCSTYKRKGKNACAVHYLKYDDIYQIVLKDIQEKIKLVNIDREKFAQKLSSEIGNIGNNRSNVLIKEISDVENRLKSIDSKFDQMYEDKLRGLLPERKFIEMTEKSEKEYENLLLRLEELKKEAELPKETSDNISYFMDIVNRYTDIQELNAEILNRFIDKIVVGNKIKTPQGYTQEITIYYQFVGDLNTIDFSK